MRTAQWTHLLREHRHKKLFSLADLAQLTNEKKPSLLVQLSRLEKARLVDRVARGWYANPFNPPTPCEIATAIRFPSYASMEYALARHSVLSQFPHTVTLCTTRLPALHRMGPLRFEYHQVSRRLFWGYRYEEGIPVAEPEKALLDLIYIRHVRARQFDLTALASLLDDMYVLELDAAKLQDYAKRFGPATRKALSEALALWEQARKSRVR